MFKKTVSIIILSVLLLTAVGSALAGGGSLSTPASKAGGLNFSFYVCKSGSNVQGIGSVSLIPKGHSVKMTVTLQRKTSSGSWTTVKTADGTDEACAEGTLVKGATYRVSYSYKVYEGKKEIKSKSGTSPAKTIN